MVTKKKAKKNICKLTIRQDRFWENSFADHLNNGDSEKVADRKTFAEMRKRFHSLKKCTGFE